MKFKPGRKEYPLLLLFACFAILRIFLNSSYHLIAADEGKYLTLARFRPVGVFKKT